MHRSRPREREEGRAIHRGGRRGHRLLYDQTTGFTAMQRMTGWHISIVAAMIAKQEIPSRRDPSRAGSAGHGFCARSQEARIQHHGTQWAGRSNRKSVCSDGLTLSRDSGKAQGRAGNASPAICRRAAAERVSSLLGWPGPICGIQFLVPPKIITRPS
jgi:hypothetical protein